MPRELGINPAMMGRQRSSRFFFFATGDGMDASSDAALYPISSLRGIRPASATSCVLFFEPMSFNNVSTGDTVDQVTINFRTGQFKNFLLDLKKLIGPEKFKESTNAWLRNAFNQSMRANPDKITLKFDAGKLADLLGMKGVKSLKTDTVKQLFKEAGISYDKIRSFIQLSKNYDGMFIPKSSDFMARRVTLAGIGALGIAGAMQDKIGGFVPFVLALMATRGASRLLSNPKALDDALFLMKDQKITMAKYLRSYQLLDFLIDQPELPEEEKKNFEVIKNHLQSEMNELNIDKINRRYR